MTTQHENVLSIEQLEAFRTAFHEGAAEASSALGRWIDKPTRISFDVDAFLPHALAETRKQSTGMSFMIF